MQIPEQVSKAARQMIRGEITTSEYLERIEPEQRAIGDLRIMVAVGAYSLRSPTTAQLRYLGLAAAGCTDEEIAENQGVAVQTVKSQLKRAYNCLGARNRTHAVVISLQRGYDLEAT